MTSLYFWSILFLLLIKIKIKNKLKYLKCYLLFGGKMSKISINSITPDDLDSSFEIVIDETTQMPLLVGPNGTYRLVIGITKFEVEHPEAGNGTTEININPQKNIFTKVDILPVKNKKQLTSAAGGVLLWQKIEDKNK